MKGVIFDIKKFAVHDGPGIRTTVFLKGCPLRCLWCHNPEGISPNPEIMVFANRCLKECRDCLAVCPRHALAKRGGTILLKRALCDGCGACAEICPSEALQLAGRTVTVAEVMTELEKDRPFYQNSAGGVTFSGGEPLQQPEFLHELLIQSRARNFHTAVDTSGFAPFALLAKTASLCDHILYDLKMIDDAKHQRLTGVSNRLILDNLMKLSRAGCSLSIRIPLVPGCNDAPADLEETAAFCAALPEKHPVHILPYHHGYSGKIKRLDLTDQLTGTVSPPPALVERAKEIFIKKQLDVKIGG